MHPHFYTKTNRGCQDVMEALEECHAKGFLHKAVGGCNEAKREVNTCLRAARLERTAMNREQSKERNAKVKEIFNEIDQNS